MEVLLCFYHSVNDTAMKSYAILGHMRDPLLPCFHLSVCFLLLLPTRGGQCHSVIVLDLEVGGSQGERGNYWGYNFGCLRLLNLLQLKQVS